MKCFKAILLFSCTVFLFISSCRNEYEQTLVGHRGPFFNSLDYPPPIVFNVKGKRNVYELKSDYYKYHVGAHIELTDDSTFVYWRGNLKGYVFAIGRYKHVGKDVLSFTWDSVATCKTIENGNYLERFESDIPKPFKMQQTMFYLRSNNLSLVESRYHTLEIFFSSNQVFEHGLVVDSLKDWPNPYKIDVKKNQFILRKKGHPEIIFPLDSIWGFRFVKNSGPGKLVRKWKNDNYFGYATIVGYNGFVIYEKAYYHNCLFSMNLDSKMYNLTYDELIKQTKEDTVFCNAIQEEFKRNKLWRKVERKNQVWSSENCWYRLLEIYKQTHPENTM